MASENNSLEKAFMDNVHVIDPRAPLTAHQTILLKQLCAAFPEQPYAPANTLERGPLHPITIDGTVQYIQLINDIKRLGLKDPYRYAIEDKTCVLPDGSKKPVLRLLHFTDQSLTVDPIAERHIDLSTLRNNEESRADRERLQVLIDQHSKQIKLEKKHHYLIQFNGKREILTLSHSLLKRDSKSGKECRYQILGGKKNRIGMAIINGRIRPKGNFGVNTISLGVVKPGKKVADIKHYANSNKKMLTKMEHCNQNRLTGAIHEYKYTREITGKAYHNWRNVRSNNYKHYLIMKWIPGIDLDNIDRADINYEFIVNFAIGLLEEVKKLYVKNLIHCDIKDENIRIVYNKETAEMKVYLYDFGLMKRATDKNSYFGGSHRYMPPEVIKCNPSLASMIFEAGVTIGELTYTNKNQPHIERWGRMTLNNFVSKLVPEVRKNLKQSPRFKFKKFRKNSCREKRLISSNTTANDRERRAETLS